MSRENVEFVRAVWDSFPAIQDQLRSGTLPLDDFVTEDIVWDASEIGLPDFDGVVTGREGVRRFWMTWLSAWEDLTFEYELRDAGDKVVALIEQKHRASGGLTTGITYAQVMTFRDGRMAHWKGYWDQGEALAAAGLSE
jgi:ketosteroid isomerase-like protein